LESVVSHQQESVDEFVCTAQRRTGAAVLGSPVLDG
jgi:hypothetical protein